MCEPWMIESAYGIAAMLPGDPKEALFVLGIVKSIVVGVSRDYLEDLPRRPRLVGGRSGALRKRRPSSGGT